LFVQFRDPVIITAMNAKKIKLHDHHYRSQMCNPQLLRDTTAALSFHQQGFVPLQNGGGGGSWPHEEYSPTPRSVLPAQGGCVGSDPASFFAAENMVGMARFDRALPPPMVGRSLEADQLYRSVEPLLLRDDSVRAYYVPPQQRDAAKAPPARLKLPLQQQEQVRGLFDDASNGRLLGGGEPKNHPFSPHVSESSLIEFFIPSMHAI
jgi:hypothetical protein